MIVVAHRVTTICGCDQVIVLADGALAEAGPPAALAARSGGAFAALVAAAAANERGGA